MVFSFRTIQSGQEGSFKEKGSRFLSFAIPVDSEEEVKRQLDGLRKKYFDARHHCFAYILGPEKNRFRANDDGEPNHSAGDPILGQIRSRNLTNVLVVVVRYFGGVKLGVGGLISAYKTAAEDALNKCVIVEREIFERMEIQYPYSSTPEVMRLVKEYALEIQEQSFEDTCRMTVACKLRLMQSLSEKIQLLIATGYGVTVTNLDR